jgi:hypothetical protein
MRKVSLVASVLSCIFFVVPTGFAADKGTDILTKPFWNLDTTYRVRFELDNIVDKDVNCACAKNPKLFKAGKDSIFREVSHTPAEMIITFDYVKDSGGGGTFADLNKPYKLCSWRTKDYKYKRAGGIDVGVLVVPFKVRSGDLYGDSTLGPYVAFKGSNISLLATFGMTQVSVSDISTEEVETASGISYAAGVIWSVTDSFDVGLVAGVDHLSGEAGDKFEFQDDVWWSFAIGYNFTTGL